MARPVLHLHSRAAFLARLGKFAGFAAGFLIVSLGLGILGYRVIGGLGWVDALYNAAMILTGMGPVDPMPSDGAKIFASLYAILGGAVYPAMTAIVLYPLLHRMLVSLHLGALAVDDQQDKTNDPPSSRHDR